MLPACEGPRYDGRFPEPADVVFAVPASTDARSQAHALLASTTAAVDHWISVPLVDVAPTMQHVADHRETRRDGDGRVFGPFHDLDDRDLSWFVILRLDGPVARFEIDVGEPGASSPAQTSSLLEGHLGIEHGRREGAFTLDMTTIDAHRALSDRVVPTSIAAGTIAATFERDEDDARVVELAFNELRVDAWSSNETWLHRRDADGWSATDLVLAGDLAGRSAPRIQLHARWHVDHGGRVRAIVLDRDELVVDECFDAAGTLSHRAASPPDAVLPGYAFGDESTCVVTVDELSRRRARTAARSARE